MSRVSNLNGNYCVKVESYVKATISEKGSQNEGYNGIA